MKGADVDRYLQEAVKQANPDLRIVAIRAARQVRGNGIAIVSQLVNDPDAQVRRECAIALHHNEAAGNAALWAALASKHDGNDRWYLEALGIGADKQWDKFFAAYRQKIKDPMESAGSRDIVWRARTDSAVVYTAKLAAQQSVPIHDRLRYFRAFDFNPGSLKSKLLLAMLEQNASGDTSINKLVLHHLDNSTVQRSRIAQMALSNVLKTVKGTPEFLDLVTRYQLRSQNDELLEMAIHHSDESLGRNAAALLLKFGGAPQAWKVINGKDSASTNALLTSIGRVGSKESINILQTIILSGKFPMEVRKQAAQRVGKTGSGEDLVLLLLKNKKVPEVLLPDVVASVQGSWRKSVSQEAAGYLPHSSGNVTRKVPQMSELSSLKTDVASGKVIFSNVCAVCHQVNKEGFDFGPSLTEIGSKYPKEGLLESIAYPSKGISFNNEGYELKMKDGSTLTGIIASKTETDISLKFPGGGKQNLKTSDVKTISQLKVSMMPEGLYENMSAQDLANLLEYLSSLKKKASRSGFPNWRKHPLVPSTIGRKYVCKVLEGLLEYFKKKQ
jgi:putative heme-binding domain-containing protein